MHFIIFSVFTNDGHISLSLFLLQDDLLGNFVISNDIPCFVCILFFGRLSSDLFLIKIMFSVTSCNLKLSISSGDILLV